MKKNHKVVIIEKKNKTDENTEIGNKYTKC